ncbi:enoyl-CoA hydratase/isomerase family protein [Polyangium mundeleinium]|uniref:Enoyl-CoA hydratase/isomerase family protein n=1 Tax=Polyangium mundeleinium TaxID=2995306 RepID=A0ABT5EFV5_9BACT|nr:enoyl-CoA hydratase/isomerase family protein [Polyangium mundeleinium]MDC0740364.1 enoyl-CoA hydratase/isomerase family protein [Polyangium mundeleinium]
MTEIIKLSGPGKNALSSVMMRHVLEGLDKAAGAPVLLTGEGDAFSAGLDLKEVLSLDAGGMIAFLRLLEQCMTTLYLYPGPTIAVVNGHAIAGGSVLAACCDVRIATSKPTAKIGLNETALGLRFPPRILAILRRRLPPQHIDEVLLGAGLFDPEKARRLGLVDEVADDPYEVGLARQAELAKHPAEVYAQTKRDLRGTADDLHPEADHARAVDDRLASWTSDVVRMKVLSALKR